LNRTEQEIGKLGSCARHAAEADEIGMHAPEMSRRLVFLGIADSPQRPVRLDRHSAQRWTRECDSRPSENPPVWMTVVSRPGRRIQRKPRATALSAGQMFESKSRTDLRSKLRSASDTPSMF
jgi:hypothetical protein